MAPLRPSYNRGLLNCLQRICSSSWLIIYANVPDYKIGQQITSTIRRWNGSIKEHPFCSFLPPPPPALSMGTLFRASIKNTQKALS